jgi:hypothetical protein
VSRGRVNPAHPWAEPLYAYVRDRRPHTTFSAEDAALEALGLSRRLTHADVSVIGGILCFLCHCTSKKTPAGPVYSRPTHMPEPPSVFL